MVGKILIVDSVATNRIALRAALREAFYQPMLAADGAGCLELAAAQLPDMILLDLALPDQSDVNVIQRLRANPVTRDIPVLALAAGVSPDVRLQALRAGADDVLEKSVDMPSLLARVRNLLRGRDGYEDFALKGVVPGLLGFAEPSTTFTTPAIVSVLSNQTAIAFNWCNRLAHLMPDKIIIQTREEAFSNASAPIGSVAPDVFLIDTGHGGTNDSLQMMSELRSRPATRHSAVCILRPMGDAASSAIAFDLGADDVVGADVSPAEMALRLQALIRRKRREDQMRATLHDGVRLSVIDPLTGLFNRRYALPRLAAIAARAADEGTVFAVMAIDLDRFKSVNDRFGHAAGDTVLAEVARRLQSNLRSDDLVARIGGEEFLVALPNTNFTDACSTADRLCQVIEELPISLDFGSTLRVTVSIGLAVSGKPQGTEPITKILDRADHALLTAKAQGRNKVNISKTAA